MARSSAKFWDRMAKGYAKRPVADEAAYQKKLEITRQHFRPDMEVLELGCGTGTTALLHAPHVKHIRAVDVSSKMLAIAQDKADTQGITNVSFEQSTVEDLNVPDQSQDMVLALSILHLLEDKEAAIAKVHQLLKPGGLFISSTVCIGETMKFLKYILPIGRVLGLIPLVKVITPQELANAITSAGFTIEHQWQPAKGKAVFIVARKA